MTAAIEHAEKGLDQGGRPNRDLDERRAPGTVGAPVTTDHTIGYQLPPIPRAARPLVAGGRKRLRSIKRAVPTGAGLVVAISLAILATVAVLIVARSRRRSPAQEFIARLERVPERINALDV